MSNTDLSAPLLQAMKNPQLTNRTLTIEVGAKLPAELQRQVDAHNKRVAAYQAASREREKSLTSLAKDITANDGNTVASASEKLRALRFDLCRERLALLQALAGLLPKVAAAITAGELAESEKLLTKTRTDSEKKLESAGFSPGPDKAKHPDAYKRALAVAVEKTDPVRKAAVELDDWQRELDRVRERQRSAREDEVLLLAELVRAWRAVVGELV